MTSGTFRSVPVSSIAVSRETRQRRELTNVPELAESIRSLGLIHPVVIRRDTNELVAGERRLAAVKSLGWTHINVQFQDELDPFALKRLELEENTRRVDIPWQDQVRAVEDYHALRKSEDPSWTQEKTAEALNIARGEVSDKLAVASEIKANANLASAERYSIARNFTRRAIERRTNGALADVTELLQAPKALAPEILNVSFMDWAPFYSGPKFNLIHCDFPYGIDAHKIQQGYKRLEHGDYADTFDNYTQLLTCFADSLGNFADDSCHLVFWFSMKYYTYTFDFLQKIGFSVCPHPLIWVKSDNSGIAPDVNRLPRQVYETALFASRGDRKIVRLVSNAFVGATTSADHMSEKPVEMLKHFFRMLIDSSSTVFDPTCGSGSALRAAFAAGAKTVLGLEIDPEFHSRASTALSAFKETLHEQL